MKNFVPQIVPPPDNFALSHIRGYVGNDLHEVPPKRSYGLYGEGKAMFVSAMNSVASKYDFDAYIILSDIVNIIPDVPSAVPTVGWIPLHTPTVSLGSVEYFSFLRFDALAILSPSSANTVAAAVGENIGKVQNVPHIIDRKTLENWASLGLKLLEEMATSSASNELRLRRFGETLNHRKEVAKIPHPVFSDAERGTFIVLMQGGNYDEQDRKGWDTSLQAFARFYNTYKNSSTRIHLYIHSMESFLIQQDSNRGKPPPAVLAPKGVNLFSRLHNLGVPRSAYTIDIYQHEPEVVAAFKRRADVCLHPSKVEGFGMNVLECQALGTPVITTNYTATGDYARFGIAVPHKQTIFYAGGSHDFALPDVAGIVDALTETFKELVTAKIDPEVAKAYLLKVEDSRQWIDDYFNGKLVGDAFSGLLNVAQNEFLRRQKEMSNMLAAGSPRYDMNPMFEVAEGEYTPTVEWDAPFTVLTLPGLKIETDLLQAFLWDLSVKQGSDVVVVIARTVYKNGEDIPITDEGVSLNDHFPVIVRTYLVSGIQNTFSRRVSIAQVAIDHAMKRQAAKQIGEIMFTLDREVALGRDDSIYDFYGLDTRHGVNRVSSDGDEL
mmetsp:Transcript_807/g.1044  ORF Transcript_807/g.1044 Transcript_807/m.1044 type:complete len:607 (-) Transcript_807:457-2277(-)